MLGTAPRGKARLPPHLRHSRSRSATAARRRLRAFNHRSIRAARLGNTRCGVAAFASRIDPDERRRALTPRLKLTEPCARSRRSLRAGFTRAAARHLIKLSLVERPEQEFESRNFRLGEPVASRPDRRSAATEAAARATRLRMLRLPRCAGRLPAARPPCRLAMVIIRGYRRLGT